MGKRSLVKVLISFGICIALLEYATITQAQESPDTAVISDGANSDRGASDNLTVSISGLALPPDGTGYIVQLSSRNGSNVFTLGMLTVDSDGHGNGSFQTNEDLIANYSRITIFFGPPDAKVFEGSLPDSVIGPARHLLVGAPSNDPLQIGYAKGTITLSALAATSAGYASAAGRNNYLDELKGHAEHIINIIDGSTVDHNADGTGTNPSPDGSLLSYASNITLTAQNMGVLGNDIADLGAQITNWVVTAKDNARKAIAQDTVTLAKVYAEKAQAALDSAGVAAIQVVSTTQSTIQYSITPAKAELFPSVGEPHIPMIPLAGIVLGLALCIASGFLLLRPGIQQIR